MLQDQIRQVSAREIVYQQEIQQQQKAVEEMRRNSFDSKTLYDATISTLNTSVQELSAKLQTTQNELTEVRKKLATKVVEAATARVMPQPQNSTNGSTNMNSGNAANSRELQSVAARSDQGIDLVRHLPT